MNKISQNILTNNLFVNRNITFKSNFDNQQQENFSINTSNSNHLKDLNYAFNEISGLIEKNMTNQLIT